MRHKKLKLSKVDQRRGRLKFLGFMGMLSFVIFAGGFIIFALKIDRLRPPSPLPKADGIVVWTGKGGGRLETGAKLLQQKKGERLLISGVNKAITQDAIKTLVKVPDPLSDCCIDLDYKAEDTVGNARETARWVKALGYEHIILVTSAYHMPRAEIEIGAAIGRVKITPYPVTAQDSKRWYNSPSRFKRIFQEYGKLLLAFITGPASQDLKGAPPLDEPTDRLDLNPEPPKITKE